MIAFSGSGTKHADAFVVIHRGDNDRDAVINLRGTQAKRLAAYRTSLGESYKSAGEFAVLHGLVKYKIPSNSVTTFFAVN